MLKLSNLISVRADAVQKNYIYLFEIRNTTESAGGLAKSHCAVKGTFCGCTDRFTAQMFINRGNISEPQYQPTTRYIYMKADYPSLRVAPPEHLHTSAPPLSHPASATACFQFPAALLLFPIVRPRSPTPETHREVRG